MTPIAANKEQCEIDYFSASINQMFLNIQIHCFSNMTITARTKIWAQRVKLDAFAVYFATKDPRTPRCLRFFAIAVAAYAISPVDLIPDFIPILGYLDDLLIVPIGLLLVIKFLPTEVLVESRKSASTQSVDSISYKFAAVVVCTWLVCVAMLSIRWYTR